MTAERLDLDTVLHEGGQITLTYDPGHPGTMAPDGEIADDPVPARYTATATDATGRRAGDGEGTSPEAALAHLRSGGGYSAVPPLDDTPPRPDWHPSSSIEY